MGESIPTSEERKTAIREELIAGITDEIERGSGNTWLACFASKLTVLGLRLQQLIRNEKTKDAAQELKTQVNILAQKQFGIATELNYQDPGEKIKNNLLDELTELFYKFEQLTC
ncbi:MAG: hypothetical protein NTZ25_05440 [Candidatus Peregrinibacteria bacterium]|nr:hypothetical protein [Candidatus Peregrinibacteria bacterium]